MIHGWLKHLWSHFCVNKINETGPRWTLHITSTMRWICNYTLPSIILFAIIVNSHGRWSSTQVQWSEPCFPLESWLFARSASLLLEDDLGYPQGSHQHHGHRDPINVLNHGAGTLHPNWPTEQRSICTVIWGKCLQIYPNGNDFLLY